MVWKIIFITLYLIGLGLTLCVGILSNEREDEHTMLWVPATIIVSFLWPLVALYVFVCMINKRLNTRGWDENDS